MSVEIDRSHCRVLVLEAVLKFFDKPYNFTSCINSTSELIAYLEINNLKCVVTCPSFFILSPLLWRLFLTHRLSARSFLELCERQSRKALIHFLSAQQLYGIEEFWTHYVCEFFSEQYAYFDPYSDQLSIDYPSIKGYEVLAPSELFCQKSIKLLVFETR